MSIRSTRSGSPERTLFDQADVQDFVEWLEGEVEEDGSSSDGEGSGDNSTEDDEG